MLESVTVTFREPGFLEDIHDLLAVADVATGAMIDVAVLFLARVSRPVVPKETRQAIGLGGLDNVLHVVKVELPGPGVGLGPHRAAELAKVARDVLGHIFLVEHAEDLLDMVLITIIRLFPFNARVPPVRILLVTDRVRARVIE